MSLLLRTSAIAGSKSPSTPGKAKMLQRQSVSIQHLGEGVLHRKCSDCRKKRELLQRRSSEQMGPAETPPIVQDVLVSPGQPLDRETRAFMEPRFGYDFSKVRVHADAKAAESARAVNALAYTVGRDVVFSADQYSPETDKGRRLIAHELSHVLQQGSTNYSAIEKKLEITDPQDESERQADRFADLAISNKSGIPGKVTRTQVSLQRACGRSEIGIVADCLGQSGDVTGEVFHFRINCDTFSPASDESRLRAFATTISSDDIIEIHGFASIDGPADFNENLSCARAHKAQSVLIEEGVSPAQIRPLIMHGATEGNATERRSIVINKQNKQPIKPQPCTISVVPGSPVPTPVGSRGGCGSGSDFTYYDFPRLSLTNELKVAPFRLNFDFQLANMFRIELGALAGSIGLSMISRFLSGSGATFGHVTGSEISNLTSRSRTFGNVLRAIRTDIDRQLSIQARGCHIDYRLLRPVLPPISFGFSDGTTLKAAIGGTQGLDLFISNFNVPPGSRTYTATLHFNICDDFGVDESDLYSPGLISFWILQHERAGHQPFINEIVVEQQISGSF
jgi:outer membrane protein OmpA-like peptidoglycan-associated protein